jgi:hypothetical protein
MGISDFGQVSGLSRNTFRKALGRDAAESKHSKATGSLYCSWISRVEVLAEGDEAVDKERVLCDEQMFDFGVSHNEVDFRQVCPSATSVASKAFDKSTFEE